MNLTTPRLLLPELTWDDLNDVHTLNAYPEVAKFNTIGIPRIIITTQSWKMTRELISFAAYDANVTNLTQPCRPN